MYNTKPRSGEEDNNMSALIQQLWAIHEVISWLFGLLKASTWWCVCPQVRMNFHRRLLFLCSTSLFSLFITSLHCGEFTCRHALLTPFHPACISLGLRPCRRVSSLRGHVWLWCQSESPGPDGSLVRSSEPLATLLEKSLTWNTARQFRDEKPDKRAAWWQSVRINQKSHLLTSTGRCTAHLSLLKVQRGDKMFKRSISPFTYFTRAALSSAILQQTANILTAGVRRRCRTRSWRCRWKRRWVQCFKKTSR